MMARLDRSIGFLSDATHPVLCTKRVGALEILYLTLGHCRGHYDLAPIADFNPIVERCS